MTVWDELAAFLADPATWSGSGSIWARSWEHIWVSIAATLVAVLLILPLALWLGHVRRGAELASAVVNIGRAVPSFGVLAIAFLLLVNLGAGVSTPWPVLVALVALAAPPVFTNAVAGILGVDQETVEAARGMGMRERDVILRVELPLAMPLIVEGVRIAFVQVIATATLGALTAWGGLGRFIIDGFATQDQGEIMVGALLVAVLAVLAEFGLARAQKATTPRGVLLSS
ncbi:MAG: ABC transporter permease subunit [Acidimicrobiia bacterium]|nr:ABC transporter permease subunit [Acidimicrobiia bacterium]